MKSDDTFNDINYCQDCGSTWTDCVCISDTWIGKRIKENLASGDEEFKAAWMEEVNLAKFKERL